MGILDSVFAFFVGGGLLHSNSLAPASSLSVDAATTVHPFLLQLGSSQFARRHVQKRQSFAFVVTEGTVPACQGATPFTLVNDQLYADGALVTADPGVAAYQPLLDVKASSGPVRGGFSVDDEGVLQWSNSNFSLGCATFCISNANVMYAVFAQGSAPQGCTTVDLHCVAASQCPLPIAIGATNINIYNTQNNYYGGEGAGVGGSTLGSDSASSATDTSILAAASGSGNVGNGADVIIDESEPGSAGTNGQPGNNGQNGTDGANGLNGKNGTVGATGPVGPPGSQGYNGTNGTNGINGTNSSTNSSGSTGSPGANQASYDGYGYTGCWVVSSDTLGGNPVLSSEVITESIDECADHCATASAGQRSLYFTLASRPKPNAATSGSVESVCTCTNYFQGSTITSLTTYACNMPCTFVNVDGSIPYCGAYTRGFYFASVFTAL